MKRDLRIILVVIAINATSAFVVSAQKFIHPGIDQTIADLTYMKEKAIEILNTWSPVLWDFDFNDAKLLAAWTGHILCNTAEILRHSKSNWQQKDIESFTNMLMTVYCPLLRYYFPQANGNWDGAIIKSIMAIGIFTNNFEML